MPPRIGRAALLTRIGRRVAFGRMRTLHRIGGLVSISFGVVAMGVCLAACVGDEPATDGPGDSSGTDAGTDSSQGDGGGVSSDGAAGTDATACVPTCSADNKSLSCGGSSTACALGCAGATAADPAHCLAMDPTGAVEPSDLSVPGVGDFALVADGGPAPGLKFFTDTGRITTADDATEIRPANAVAGTQEVTHGIGFRLVAGKVGIFQFKNLTLPTSAAHHTATGSVALAIVASEEIKIGGVLDLACAIPNIAGSHAGAAAPPNASTQVNGMGPGAGQAGNTSPSLGTVISGGGGGGHAAIGGPGGDGLKCFNCEALVFGGLGGTTYDDTTFDPPLGGSGGGAGAGSSTLGGAGGGSGGGAMQLVAGKRITIGDGTGPAANGAGELQQGINAGGCGGGGVLSPQSAGGGGSGGSIVLEAPEIVGKANAGVASNGGGGGGVGSLTGTNQGQNAVISAQMSQGEAGSGCLGTGGNGGAGAATAGTTGVLATSGTCADTSTKYGGGGGGSAGRVRINTLTGTITVDPSFVISPSGAGAYQKGTIVTR